MRWLWSLELNGNHVHATVPAHRTLLDMLRDDLGLFRAPNAVVLKVSAVPAPCSWTANSSTPVLCSVPRSTGESSLTIEGLSMNGVTDLQAAFLATGAVQCGVCIPGQVMAAEQLLQTNPDASRDEIRDVMSGNLCRCASYQRIVEAIQAAAVGRRSDA